MTDVTRTGPPPMVDESLFVPRDLGEARALYQGLLKVTSAQHAKQILAWLITYDSGASPLSAGERVRRSRYRQVLRKLGAPPRAATALASAGSGDQITQNCDYPGEKKGRSGHDPHSYLQYARAA